MKNWRLMVIVLMVGTAIPAAAQDILKQLPGAGSSTLSDEKIISGLKEALRVGAEKTVSLTGESDGFFRNEAIKILMPDKLKSLEKGLRAAGLGSQVDELVLSMNRAAESAAPAAKDIFVKAVQDMSFEDARKIYSGGDSAATEYFRAKTTDSLRAAFKPFVDTSLSEAGVTRRYKELMGRAKSIPFMKTEAFDLEGYVLDKSLEGLFKVLAAQEKEIRTNPAARVTDLLKEVFSK
jgi:hypothetical protein